MRVGKSCCIICFLSLVVILSAGCSSSGGGGDSIDPTPGYETYTTAGSDLVLRIPDSLVVSQEDIEEIHSLADLVPHCYTSSQDPVDIVLAEACIYYDYLYLFPQYFPQGLDALRTVSAYVAYLEQSDPFTFYLSPQDFDYVMSFFYGESAYIGFLVECDGLTISDQTPLVITEIVPFTRAWIDGFQAGDKIVEIDGVSIIGMSLDAARLLFPTDEEETVEITVDRNDVEITIYTAAEENIALLIYGDIAYLNARSFTETTGEEIRFDFDELLAEAGGTIDKLILDLRDNGGGSVSGMLELIDYLIDNDNGTYPIMTVWGPDREEETRYLGSYNDNDIGNFDETNFVLLIDEDSASASEIVAAALKHYGTAALIGETTFGKGIGQSIAELIDESGVVIPSFETLPPSGESYHVIGVSPDYQLSAVVTSFDDDPVLDAAVEYLNTGTITIAASGRIMRKNGTLGKSSSSQSEKIIDPLQEQLLERLNNNHH